MNHAQRVARQLGLRIREARRQHGLTLQKLGQDTDLSAAFLSRIERGEAGASIANLIVIATRLGITLRDFFEDAGPAQPSRNFAISRHRERNASQPLAADGYTFQWLSGDLPEPELSAFLLEFPAGADEDIALLTHEGEEILYLLDGKIEFQIGPDRFILEAGDCVHFNCEKPHMGRNVGKKPAKMLMIVTPSRSVDGRLRKP